MIAVRALRSINPELVQEWREHEQQRLTEPPLVVFSLREKEMRDLLAELSILCERRDVRKNGDRFASVLLLRDRVAARLKRGAG